MTATLNKQGEIILHTRAVEKLGLKNGDLFVLAHDSLGRLVLQKRTPKRRMKSYLNPAPLPSATRARLYTKPDAAQERLEAEAVAAGRRALAGRKLDEL